VNLAIVTLAIVEVVQNLVFQLATGGGVTGGANVGPPRFLGLKFGPLDSTSFRPPGDTVAGLVPNPIFGVFCIVVAALVVLLTYWIRRSRTGLRFLAVRSDERAAATAGISVVRTKLLAFVVAAGVAGVAGMLSAYRFGTVTPDYFGDIQSLLFFAFAYLGGLGGVGGAIGAGLFMPGGIGTVMSAEWLHLPPQFFTLIGGLGLVLTVVTNPDGIAPKTIEAAQKLWDLASVRLGALPRRGSVGTAAVQQATPGAEGTGVPALPAHGADGETVPVTSSQSEGSGR
jgi:ABC-type branched-subunit amino acid transport system permease subunit